MLEEKLTFVMRINEEIITVTCLLILGIYGLHDELDFLGETGVKVLDYSFLGAFIYGFLIEILHVLYHQLVSLYGLCVKIKKSCSKNKVGQECNAKPSRMTTGLMIPVSTRPVQGIESARGKFNDEENAKCYQISPLKFSDKGLSPDSPNTHMKTNDPENKLGIPKGKVTPRNKISARRLIKNISLPPNTSLPVPGMDPLYRNMNIFKKSVT